MVYCTRGAKQKYRKCKTWFNLDFVLKYNTDGLHLILNPSKSTPLCDTILYTYAVFVTFSSWTDMMRLRENSLKALLIMRENIKGCKHWYFTTTQVFQHKEKNKTTGTYTGLTHSDIDVCRSPFGNTYMRPSVAGEHTHIPEQTECDMWGQSII